MAILNDPNRPIIDFNLPGFLEIVQKKGMQKAALISIRDLLIMTHKALSAVKARERKS